jgi:hypothetical protein
MSFLTAFTPATPRATSTALLARSYRAHETTQLHHTLERLNVDLGGLQRGIIEDGGLHLGLE